MIKCKYAGDVNDEFCRGCDGLELVDGKDKYEATRCEGYEPEEEVKEVKEEVVESKPIYISKATTHSIKFESGISREINGMWYKFNYSEERILGEGSDLNEEIMLLCEHCNSIVDKQVAEVLN